MGFGGVLGLAAKSSYESAPGCSGTVCQATYLGRTGLNQRNSAMSLGDVATGVVIGGAVLSGAGIMLLIVAPSMHREAAARVRLDVAGRRVVLEGKF
jgi:hypothetical protein